MFKENSMLSLQSELPGRVYGKVCWSLRTLNYNSGPSKNALDKPWIRTLEKQPELKQDSPFYPWKEQLKGKGRIRAAVAKSQPWILEHRWWARQTDLMGAGRDNTTSESWTRLERESLQLQRNHQDQPLRAAKSNRHKHKAEMGSFLRQQPQLWASCAPGATHFHSKAA